MLFIKTSHFFFQFMLFDHPLHLSAVSARHECAIVDYVTDELGHNIYTRMLCSNS